MSTNATSSNKLDDPTFTSSRPRQSRYLSCHSESDGLQYSRLLSHQVEGTCTGGGAQFEGITTGGDDWDDEEDDPPLVPPAVDATASAQGSNHAELELHEEDLNAEDLNADDSGLPLMLDA